MIEGFIIKGIGGFYYVKTEDGVYECKPRGIFRKNNVSPIPGDRCQISILDNNTKLGCIDEILPRSSELIRPSIANVNQIAIVISTKSPAIDFELLDKLLVTCEIKDIQKLICINKIDLDVDGNYKTLVKEYREIGYTVLELSLILDTGFEELEFNLTGKMTVFAGQSGVGKSTIINKIMSSMLMETGEVSEKISRGKHTTRHAQLLELKNGGYVADTPGFSIFDVEEITHEELLFYFPEFKEYLDKCRFKGCSHLNEPDCAVKVAVNEGKISLNRYKNYSKIFGDLKEKHNSKNFRNYT